MFASKKISKGQSLNINNVNFLRPSRKKGYLDISKIFKRKSKKKFLKNQTIN